MVGEALSRCGVEGKWSLGGPCWKGGVEVVEVCGGKDVGPEEWELAIRSVAGESNVVYTDGPMRERSEGGRGVGGGDRKSVV